MKKFRMKRQDIFCDALEWNLIALASIQKSKPGKHYSEKVQNLVDVLEEGTLKRIRYLLPKIKDKYRKKLLEKRFEEIQAGVPEDPFEV